MAVEVHDHFDGSMHCVECGGKCILPPAEQLATQLIRYIFEQWAIGYSSPNMLLTSTIKDSGVDMERFRRRAKETCEFRAAS